MKPSFGRRYGFSLALLALIFLLYYLGVFKPLASSVRLVFSPLISKIYHINIVDAPLKSKTEIFGQLQVCLSQNQDASYWQAQTESILKDNAELKKQLNFKTNKNYSSIATRVIGRGADTNYQTLILDAGQKNGIEVGQPVITGNGVMIGKIIKSEPQTAWVQLLNDNRSKVAAMVLNGDSSIGVVEGGYGLSIKMDFIPRNELVKIGDLIVTSGLEAGIPRGLLIGEISAVENEAYKPFQQAVITPAANLDKINLVTVIMTAQ